VAISRTERRLILLFVVIAICAIGSIGYGYWLRHTVAIPSQGGTYTEGLVAASVSDITPSIDVLTKTGFVQLNQAQVALPAAAQEWTIADDGKTYTFIMRPELSLDMIRSTMLENAKLFPDITNEVTDDHKVIFHLQQAFAPFLATTAEPIFPVGSFRLASQEKGIVHLTARSDALLFKPYLEEIILRVYSDSFSLTKALASGDIDGVADTTTIDNPLLLNQLAVWSVPLPRKMYVFFNVERDAIKDASVRTKLKNNQILDHPIDLKLVTLANPKNEQLAQDLIARWQPLGVHLTPETRTATELARDVIPTREYDVLIYGLDFGGDPDPYPFWHSSQISDKGLNLSNFAQIDADRLLEKARQERNPAERTKLYDQFQAIFDREVPAIELEQVTGQFATSIKLKGVSAHAGLSLANRFDTVSSWYLKTKRVRQAASQ
jgi:ABC-type transport system substrate-binding protein